MGETDGWPFSVNLTWMPQKVQRSGGGVQYRGPCYVVPPKRTANACTCPSKGSRKPEVDVMYKL